MRKTKGFYLFALILLAIAYWLFASLLWGSRSLGWLIVVAIGVWLSASALAWAAKVVSARGWIYAGFLILAALALPTHRLFEIFPDRLSLPFGTPIAITLFLIPSIALVIVAFLLYSGRKLYREWQNAGATEGGGPRAQRKQAGRAVAVVLGLSALLLAKTLHNLYWLTFWDNTNDPLGYLWLGFPVLAALFSGVILSATLAGRTKLVGFLYSLLTVGLMIAISARAQSVDFRRLTEERAGRAGQAIETYYARQGRYPQDLRQATPWYVRSLPGPVIIYGQDWCYDGGDDTYRLGYVYREHWSAPGLTGRITSAKGEAPYLHPICDEEIAALRKRHPWMERQ